MSAGPDPTLPADVEAVVIGAGQAGLSASWHLRRLGVEHVVLDGGSTAGGAWAHRWPTLAMATVNGVHDLPGTPLGAVDPRAPASAVVSAYFAGHEQRWHLPVLRPVRVTAVRRDADRLVVEASDGRAWAARAVLSATGTWTRPFRPSWPGLGGFGGRQLHTADYRGPDELAGARVAVVGAGLSAVQLLLEVAEVADTTWVTRRPPVFRDSFDEDARRRAVALVEERVRAGLPPGSVVSVTGVPWTPQLRAAAERGLLERLPVPDRVVPDGLVWHHPAPGAPTHLGIDVLLWCTGFRPALGHLAPLRLREAGGGIRVEGTAAVREPRLHLLGYGPSASTVGADRAGRAAAVGISAALASRDSEDDALTRAASPPPAPVSRRRRPGAAAAAPGADRRT